MTKKRTDISEIWKIALAQIEVKLDNPTTFRTWFQGTKLVEISNNSVTIGVRHSYAADWINKHHKNLVLDTLSYVSNNKFETLEYKVSTEPDTQKYEPETELEQVKEENEPSLLDLEMGNSGEFYRALERAKINPKYKFKDLVIGDSNQMAIAAAKAVSQNLGNVYNPLFLYGKPGLGKTHIAHAVAINVLEKNPTHKVIYVPAETFMIQMVNSIRTGRTKNFRDKYRDEVELLIIDDIQFISDWEKTQTEFFNTFNALYSAGKQIIIISDRPPEELTKLTPRLKSRFQGGIVADIARPDFEHRIAILEKKQNTSNVDEASRVNRKNLEYIARLITDNIRELEGALQKVILMNSLVGHNVSEEEIAKQLGKDVESRRRQITVKDVISEVATSFNLKISDIKGKRRTKDVSLARQICMYILREELNYKLEEIANFLNRKDHTTIMHGIEKVLSLKSSDEAFNELVYKLISDLNEA